MLPDGCRTQAGEGQGIYLSSDPQQQLSPLTVGDAGARQGVSEHQSMQMALPPSAQSLSDPLQLSVATVFLTALWEPTTMGTALLV